MKELDNFENTCTHTDFGHKPYDETLTMYCIWSCVCVFPCPGPLPPPAPPWICQFCQAQPEAPPSSICKLMGKICSSNHWKTQHLHTTIYEMNSNPQHSDRRLHCYSSRQVDNIPFQRHSVSHLHICWAIVRLDLHSCTQQWKAKTKAILPFH